MHAQKAKLCCLLYKFPFKRSTNVVGLSSGHLTCAIRVVILIGYDYLLVFLYLWLLLQILRCQLLWLTDEMLIHTLPSFWCVWCVPKKETIHIHRKEICGHSWKLNNLVSCQRLVISFGVLHSGGRATNVTCCCSFNFLDLIKMYDALSRCDSRNWIISAEYGTQKPPT